MRVLKCQRGCSDGQTRCSVMWSLEAIKLCGHSWYSFRGEYFVASKRMKECFEELASVGFTRVPENLRDALREWCATFQNTKVVEDMFQRIRNVETERKAAPFGPLQVWMAPVHKQVLSTVHLHREVDISERQDGVATYCDNP